VFENINIFGDLKSAGVVTVETILDNLTNIFVGIVVILIFILSRKCLSKQIAKMFTKIFKSRPAIGEGIRVSIQNPLKSFFLVIGFYIGIIIMGPPVAVMKVLNLIFRISFIVLITWTLANFTPYATAFIIKMEDSNDRGVNVVAIKFIANIAKIIIIALSVVVIISELGYDISGLITGLGLGGLTFSLAAQSTAANLFAGFSLISDKPFNVGDYIVTPSVEGEVEDITMRSTQVRTVQDTVIIVPNSKLVDEPITNCSLRDKRLVDFKIGLTYDVSAETLKTCISKIKKMLEKNEKVNKDRIVVAFDGFTEKSQDIRIIYLANTSAHDECLEIREDVNFKIKEIVETLGAKFAIPSISLYKE